MMLVSMHVTNCVTHESQITNTKHKNEWYHLEALRELRPPWPRQIINPILPSVSINQVFSGLTTCIERFIAA